MVFAACLGTGSQVDAPPVWGRGRLLACRRSQQSVSAPLRQLETPHYRCRPLCDEGARDTVAGRGERAQSAQKSGDATEPMARKQHEHSRLPAVLAKPRGDYMRCITVAAGLQHRGGVIRR